VRTAHLRSKKKIVVFAPTFARFVVKKRSAIFAPKPHKEKNVRKKKLRFLDDR
jgi:hypothetical protein